MSDLSNRYLAALGELSQSRCVTRTGPELTHVLSGVRIASRAGHDSNGAALLKLRFGAGQPINVVAYLYFELQLAEDAAHNLHAVSVGSGAVHERAAQRAAELRRKHDLPDQGVIQPEPEVATL